MKALVTGGAGFIGSHLVERLIQEGWDVLCVDNLLTGKKENISHLLSNKKCTFLERDVTTSFSIKGPLHAIFHLASPASPVDYSKFPIETLLVNSQGTFHMLDLARKKQAKFLYTSTSETYGDPKEHPQKESYWGYVNPVGPRSCYDEAKRFGEALTVHFARMYDIDARIVRIFNTYGPRMKTDDGRVVSTFVVQALKQKPLTIYGDGSQTRSFCFVSDMVDGIMKAQFTSHTRGEVFNLGNPDERTILEFAEIVRSLVQSKSSIVFKDLPVDDPTRRCPNISKARKTLKWQPKVDLNQGLKETVRYYKNIQENRGL